MTTAMVRCTQPGCDGMIEDGYCNTCGLAAPAASLMSMKKWTCGLVHSTFVTVPLSVVGFLPSYSAANE